MQVEVQVPPKIEPMDEQSVIEGETASVKCVGTGKPPPSYSWIKENTREDLSSTNRFSVNKITGMLILNEVKFEDNGLYKCYAKNPAGTVETTVKINVLVKPKIFELINITAPVKSETKIICKAQGRPAPKVVFRKLSNQDSFVIGPQNNDKRIILEQSVDGIKGETVAILNFNNLNRTDDGLYECIAKNDVGNAYKNGHITVEFPPTFEKVKNYPPVWTWDNKPGNLTCIAESIPNATIKWRFAGIDIENGTNPNMFIQGSGPSSNLIVNPFNQKRFFHKYECIATNKLGQARHFIELKQAAVPLPVQQATIEALTATTIKFNIVGPLNLDGLPIRAFIVFYLPERDQRWDFARNHTWSYGNLFFFFF